MQFLYAITGTVFFAIFLVGVVFFGDETARNFAIFAAFVGGVSQYIAQDGRDIAAKASIALAYASMLTGLIGFVIMCFN